MPTQAETVQYQSQLQDITVLSWSDLLAFWRSQDLADTVGLVNGLREFTPDLLDQWGTVAAETAASFYDEARASAGARGSYLADLPTIGYAEDAQAAVSWASEALLKPDGVVDLDAALSRLNGKLDLAIGGSARDTVTHNVDRDPARPKYARHASSGACAFCALMATRGPVFHSESSAAKKYHDFCRCVAVPVFGADSYEAAPYVADWERGYVEARKATGSTKAKVILAEMRRTLGLR